jgi:hypothetical protein
MAWPNSDVDTTDVDSDLDQPVNARVDLLDLVQKFNQIRNHVTSFAQTFLDDASAGAVLATLGCQDMATQASNNINISGGTIRGITLGNTNYSSITLADAATINWDVNSGSIATIVLGGNRALATPTNLQRGVYILHVVQDSTGNRALSFSSAFKWAFATAPVLSTGASKRDVISLVCDGTNLYGSYIPDVR